MAEVDTDEQEPAGGVGREHGARLIAALEELWAAVRARHADLPPVVMITGSASGRRRGAWTWGHHWADRWVTDPATGAKVAELFISGELVAAGPEHVLTTMLHEGAHALADVRRIRDTSAEGGRYHNKRFVKLAVEMSLAPPTNPASVIGWSECTLPPATAAAYAQALTDLGAARPAALHDPYALAALSLRGPIRPAPAAPGRPASPTGGAAPGGLAPTGPDDGEDQDPVDLPAPHLPAPPAPARPGLGRAGRRLLITCGCTPPRRLQATPATCEQGPVLCGVCGCGFEPPDD